MNLNLIRYGLMITSVTFAAGTVQAQWLSSDIYDQPLKQVLDQMEHRYDVKLTYDDRLVRDHTVVKAPWRFDAEVEPTLDNVLRPFDLRWSKTGNGTYAVTRWDYYRKPFAEGEAHLKKLLASYPDRESWNARKADMRAHISNTLGLVGLKKCPLNPIVSAQRKYDGYTVENVALEVLPGVWVGGSLYKPGSYSGKIPLFLSPHGHFSHNDVNERGRYRPEQQLRCAMLARMGVAVFSYDMFGWGDSGHAFTLQDHRSDLGLVMQTWQSIRILDYLCEQPWADVTRVGITGASGGGTQVMLLTALDDRVTLCVPTVMMASHFYGGCPCESGLPIHFPEKGFSSNNAEIAAMAAPIPQLVISIGNDWTTTTPDIELPYLKQIYGYYGKESEVENVHLAQENHDYGINKRTALYDFTARKFRLDSAGMKNSTGAWDESKITIETAGTMMVFAEGKLPDHAVKEADNLRELLKTYRDH